LWRNSIGYVDLEEQDTSDYAVAIASENGRYACIFLGYYPRSSPDRIFSHREPHIVVKYTSDNWTQPHLFGFFLGKKQIIQDYKNSEIEPNIQKQNIDGGSSSIPLN
jgi:hypothetical protein